MTPELLIQLIGSLGFPIAMCSYIVVKMNDTIKENSKAISDLSTLVQRLIDKEDGKRDE